VKFLANLAGIAAGVWADFFVGSVVAAVLAGAR
jgi:hypothetical protein